MYAKKTVPLEPGAPRPYYSYWGNYERESEAAFAAYREHKDFAKYREAIYALREKHNVVAS